MLRRTNRSAAGVVDKAKVVKHPAGGPLHFHRLAEEDDEAGDLAGN
jgi:hypothetical protein